MCRGIVEKMIKSKIVHWTKHGNTNRKRIKIHTLTHNEKKNSIFARSIFQ